MLRVAASAVILCYVLQSEVRGADALSSAVRDAVSARKLLDSNLKGTGSSLTPYRDLATDGGVLVGIEVALGGPSATEHVVAVRPIYRTAKQTRTGAPAGRFLADVVTRTVRLVGREDYAVTTLTYAGDRQVEGLSLRFARMSADGLNPTDAYDSEWVGSTSSTRRESLDGRGRPIVGLFGRLEDGCVFALGTTFVDMPRAPNPPAAVTPPPATQQSLVNEPAEGAGEVRGFNFLPIIVFGAVAVPIGLVSLFALRRPSGGVKRLPQPPPVSEITAKRPAPVQNPPSIPSDVLDLDELIHTKIPSPKGQIQTETECVVRWNSSVAPVPSTAMSGSAHQSSGDF